MDKILYSKPLFLFTTAGGTDITASQEGTSGGEVPYAGDWAEWWSEMGTVVSLFHPEFDPQNKETWPVGFDPQDPSTYYLLVT